ncbi:MAG: pyruvate kinase [Methylococcales bacterium]|nr:pyruvate kinase [Methylococcales bacterium]MBT7410466.1 pyruvate kinase [Methylococcales bacterium]
MKRRTKIIATLGPATEDPKVMDEIISAGIDVVRVNFSHDKIEEHVERIETLRNRVRSYGHQIGVLVDLQGPKIRIEKFKKGKIKLKKDSVFILDTNLDKNAGDENRVGINYANLAEDVSRGDTLLLDDGAIVLWVNKVEDNEITCKVIVGGKLSDNKGLNRQGGGLSAPALTEKDKEDLVVAAEMNADFVAVSFVRSASDIEEARELFQQAGGTGGIIAKIERAEALDSLEELIDASDAIMIGRGDLGVEVGDAELPALQKKIIRLARQKNSVVITATQMMQSMVNSPIPTRAEVFDVANAVLDGTDAVMLCEETATGQYPAKVVIAMDRICKEAEKQNVARISDHRLNTRFGRIDEAIAMSTMYTANHLGVAAIAALTESGDTAKWMSRISSGIPIYALTRHVETRRKVTLYRGVYPVSFDVMLNDTSEVNQEIIDELQRRGAVRNGDLIVVTMGDVSGERGGSNVMKIIRVSDS